ncbi:MAG: glycosyltransferase [Candidatus Poseidoniaceae archaeon]|jgi:glycosyltransferase involved in cell wall biosynthesis|nr:glycosyltransferase [Candidatus Poseidoniaceae archaeon]
MAGGWLALGELGLAIIGFAPFALHRLQAGHWAKNKLSIPKQISNNKITVLLPVWNEGLIIEKKLSDIASQSLKVELLVVDSASTDNTVEKIQNWLRDYPNAFSDHSIIQMKERKGKTPAVMLGLDFLSDKKGIIVMTDADAFFPSNAFERILRWFSDSTIGAVGGTPNRKGAISAEETYRDIYTMLRVGESAYDSTPFLEGSLLAWRSGKIDSSDLYPTANADDAQIATAIRLGGLRSIQDPGLIFEDQMPSTLKGQRRQKVRRAQGLIRLLVRNRKYWFSSRLSRFSVILRRNAWMHIISPLAITGGGLLAILRNLTYLPETNLMGLLSIVELYSIASWASVRFGYSIFGLKTAGTILVGLENLMAAIIATGRGRSLHMWEQHSDIRKKISEEY